MVNPLRGNFHYGGPILVLYFPDSEFQEEKDDETDFRIYSCTNCGYPNIAEMTSEFSVGEIEDDVQSELRIIRWLPFEPIGKDYDSVPSDIASVASEAHKCQQIGAYRAANILARTTIEAVINEQLKKAKINNQVLGQEMDNLRKGGELFLEKK